MIPSSFAYARADTVDGALHHLVEHGDECKVLAGGHSLLPLLKLRLAAPAFLVDVGPVAELRYIREEGDEIAVGALTRHEDLVRSEVLSRHNPMLAGVAQRVGDRQVRRCGTLGGSIAHADPASDLPAVALAQHASFVTRSVRGERRFRARHFFTGFLETALEPDEILTEIRFPKLTDVPWAFEKFSRRSIDWAIVGVAAVAPAGSGTGLAFVNMAATPVPGVATEAALSGGASISEAAAVAADGLEPPSDNGGSADYRRHLARVLTERALTSLTPTK